MSNRKTVLIVDDEADLREVISDTLSLDETLDILQADSKAQALATARSGAKIDIIVCDLNMKDGKGLDVHRQIKHMNIPFIILTGEITQECVQEKKNSNGLLVNLEKPFDSEKLLATIRSLLGVQK
jgi:DNA-binding NtrC family response regulator